MFISSRIVFIIGLLVTSQGYMSSAELVESTEVEVRAYQPIDIFLSLRIAIQMAIDNLRNMATAGNQLINSLAASIQQQQDIFMQSLNNNIIIINEGIQNTINSIINSGQTVISTITECVNQQTVIVQNKVNESIAEIRVCINTAVTSLQSVVTDGRNLMQSGIALTLDVANKTQACGFATIFNMAQVGNCLNQVWMDSQPQINSLLNQILVANTNALNSIVTVAPNFAVCGGSSIFNTITTIISSIAQCGAQG